MKVLITGSSAGIGKAAAELFLARGHEVIGLDLAPAAIRHPSYAHVQCSIEGELPSLEGIEILVNNAGVQGTDRDIEVNLKGTIHVTETYGFQKSIRSVLIVASASASTGSEFPYYSASKGGLLSYTRNVAMRLAPQGAVCNSLSPGGVKTDLNKPVMEDRKLWNEIMKVTPLRKWSEPEEIAEWIYFLTVINRSASGEDFLVDNGEARLNQHFVWPED